MTGERDFLVGKRVTVIGLGIEGVDVARYAAEHGAATVTILDSKPPEALAGRMQQLRGLPISYELGTEGSAAIAASDIVFASQSVPASHPLLETARRRGIDVSSMMRAFLEHCPGPSVGITGSSGKTTTTSLVARIFATEGRSYRVGGNIGVGLLGLLDGIDAQTWSVLEISHNQLQLAGRSPHIAAVTNVTPNHLDQFSWEEYVALKQNIVRHQRAGDIAVLNLDDAIAAAMAELTPARVHHFTVGDTIDGDGAFVRDGAVFIRRDNLEEMVLPVAEIPLRGAHNVANVCAAAAIASAAGVPGDVIARAVRTFQSVPHRLELVAVVGDVSFVNDSIASTPERTIAGIRSFSEPLVLLLGGKDKDLPKETLAREAVERCHGIVFFGHDGPLFEAAVDAHITAVPADQRPRLVRVGTLEEAVRAARAMAQPGDVVLLSPAGTSFDAFANFEERGERFRDLVLAMLMGAS
jgi:UDP-N-acetylmuramoylalanine--D-glutamate ligase